MDYITYRKLAPRTFARIDANYAGLVFNPLAKRLDELHCVIGFVTEAAEFWQGFFKEDEVNMQEELGDLLWYMANLENLRDLPMRQLQDRLIVDSTMSLTELCDELLDVYKKRIFYNTDKHDAKINHFIGAIKACVIEICIEYKFDVPKMLENNIDKLRARYPEKFTTEDADNRDLSKERKILER